MDQAQKDSIDELAVEIAEELRANDFARKLRMIKLVPEERIDTIMNEASSDFARNMKLLNAVQDCESEDAFSDLRKVLKDLDSTSATRLSKKGSPCKAKSCNTSGGSRSLLNKLLNFKSKGKYPLGISSSQLSTSSPCHGSSDIQTTYLGESTIASSPFKEKHQTTLISSNSSASSNTIQDQTESQPGTFRLRRRNPDGPLSGQMSKANNMGDENATDNGLISSELSQTTSRYNELMSISNNSQTKANQQRAQMHCHELRLNITPPLSEIGDDEPIVSWHPYAQSLGDENAPRASSPHQCMPCYSSASSESGESTSDSVIVDPTLILDSDVMNAIARDGPNMMTVKTAETCHNNPEEDYKMTARPRGNCLIVNNINFEGDIFPTRKGSDEDANRFDQIFRQLGFNTIMTRNLTADQMRYKFRELSVACKPEHDALFVFILSHGSEHGIYGTDGMEVYLDSEILSFFDNRNCKAMIGKPKVFVIQACRGRSKDCGGEGETTDSIAWAPAAGSPVVRSLSQEYRVPDSWLPSQPSNGKRRKHPIHTDMLIVFSCLAGFVSVRNETAGSWLGVALAYFIMTHAHERDFLRILNLVTSDIIQRESSQGHIQSIELKLLGWTKNLYFNPGFYA